ncbi:hypothetical protein F0L17_20675 [Streptomyces sp. TRM43335]|uniref:DUF4190 domain-containing protein n=1 Tax=Streptomyces taklimakanensis TaxID=2569853 RepID=A0A6G2BHW0_9ACTN|nr:hypothetical protein [Streptomyces taklimakanensis]MTE21482.1 hypothetical protein [Streptomyces taklimakanensis]
MSYPNQPYQPQPPNTSNTLSVVGIVLGCVAFFFCPPLFGIAGIVCGVIANSKGERLAKTAIGVSVAGLVLGMILGFFLFRSVYGA